jgi:hypothetical protein
MANEHARPDDHVHSTGPEDMARAGLQGTGTRLLKALRPEGKVSTWRVPVVRDRLADLR